VGLIEGGWLMGDVVKVTVLGSFGDLAVIESAVEMLQGHGLEVLQPTKEHLDRARPHLRLRNTGEGWRFLEKLGRMEAEYLEAIDQSDFVFCANNKDGKEYVGQSTAFELGWSVRAKKPIMFLQEPTQSIYRMLVHTGWAMVLDPESWLNSLEDMVARCIARRLGSLREVWLYDQDGEA